MSKISIIVPVFNVEKYLPKCLDSLINQTFLDIEIICVNDGSKDNSLDVLKNYCEKDKRIRIIDKVNGGLSSARNEGLKYVSSENIMFVDSDDWIEKDTCEKAYNIINNNVVDLVSWGAKIVADEGVSASTKHFKRVQNYHKIKNVGIKEFDLDVVVSTPVTVCNKLFKNSIIKKFNITFPEGLIYEDN